MIRYGIKKFFWYLNGSLSEKMYVFDELIMLPSAGPLKHSYWLTDKPPSTTIIGIPNIFW